LVPEALLVFDEKHNVLATADDLWQHLEEGYAGRVVGRPPRAAAGPPAGSGPLSEINESGGIKGSRLEEPPASVPGGILDGSEQLSEFDGPGQGARRGPGGPPRNSKGVPHGGGADRQDLGVAVGDLGEACEASEELHHSEAWLGLEKPPGDVYLTPAEWT